MRPTDLFTISLLLFTATLLGEPESPKEKFLWAGWEIPATAIEERGSLAIVEDESAESKRKVKGEDGQEKEVASSLEIRVSRRAIAKGDLAVALTPQTNWKSIVSGVYRVSARIKYAGDSNLIGTPVRLGIDTPGGLYGAAQEFHCFDIGDENAFAEVSFLYEVDPTFTKRLKARAARHSWHYGAYLKEAYPAYEPEKTAPPKLPEGLRVFVTLPRTKYSAYSGMPPNSVRTVNVDWVKLERVQPTPGLTVRHIRAQKRWVRPGDKQTFDVAVENFQAQPLTRTLLVMLVRGIDERQEIHRSEIQLQPGETKTVAVDWQTTPQTQLWGYEVRAEARDGDRVDSAEHDVFSLHTGAYYVHIMGTNYRKPHPFKEWEKLQNLMEVFAASTGDCAQVMPQGEQWLCGMSIIPQSFKIVRRCTDYNRSMGVATHMYLFAGGTGEAVMDMYIRKPEWLGSRLVATDEVYRMRQATSVAIRKHDFSTGPFEMPKTPHIEEGLNHWFPELMEKITRESIEFVRKTGYDGIRFDVGIFAPKTVQTVFGEPLPFKSEDMMKHAAKNFEGFKDALRKEFPNFEFGANMDSWAYLETVGRRNEKAPDPETYPEFVAFARAGGMLMDEGTMSAPFFDHYMNRFEDALYAMVQKRAVSRRFGGVYQLFSPHRDGTGYFAHDDIYFAIMMIASGSYYVGNFAAAPYCEDSPGEFITRFSEFFRSMNLQSLADAEEKIVVDSPEQLWYADAAVWEDIGNRRRYVIPIINPPMNDRFRRNKSNELPRPIEEAFPIEVRVPEGYRTALAWMLTWEPRTSAVPLKVQVDGGKAKVEFPGIKLFRTLVVEFEK